jgi:DNA-binding MarR family transcriptional regulator
MKEILREIGKIARCFESISNIEFKEFHLEKGQYIYLVRICENPGIIQERVAEMLNVDRATASRAIMKLESNGFVEKNSSPDNKKILLLYPTQKGARIFEVLKKEEEYSNRTALCGISGEEQALVLNYLVKMRKNIETDWELVKKGGKRAYLNGPES